MKKIGLVCLVFSSVQSSAMRPNYRCNTSKRKSSHIIPCVTTTSNTNTIYLHISCWYLRNFFELPKKIPKSCFPSKRSQCLAASLFRTVQRKLNFVPHNDARE